MPVEGNVAAAITELAPVFGDRLSTSLAVRTQHGAGFSYHKPVPADAVVFPQSTAEVQQAVRICARHRAPIIPFGAGTATEGHVAALKGGICFDLSGLNQILAVHQEDMDAVVQAGVTRKQLNAYIRDTGLFFPVDPGADATLGGMASTRASGTNAVRYGTMRDMVMALEIVTAQGEIMRLGNRARKSSTGYDLTRLFTGAEGTLGLITELTLRLVPIPEAIAAAICPFASLQGAVESVVQIIQEAIPAAKLELLDEFSVRAANLHGKLDLTVAPTLFLEFSGSEAAVREQTARAHAITHDFGGGDFQWSLRHDERERIWKARHDTGWAAREMRPGAMNFSTDACVPISRLAENILAAHADLNASGIPGRVVGHVGDGNFHVTYLVMPEDETEIAEAKRLARLVVERAIAAEGTASGEHGVGYGKLPYMALEHGASMALMRRIKAALDPDDIMNPGKLVG